MPHCFGLFLHYVHFFVVKWFASCFTVSSVRGQALPFCCQLIVFLKLVIWMSGRDFPSHNSTKTQEAACSPDRSPRLYDMGFTKNLVAPETYTNCGVPAFLLFPATLISRNDYWDCGPGSLILPLRPFLFSRWHLYLFRSNAQSCVWFEIILLCLKTIHNRLMLWEWHWNSSYFLRAASWRILAFAKNS